jgi:hypothetical protein
VKRSISSSRANCITMNQPLNTFKFTKFHLLVIINVLFLLYIYVKTSGKEKVVVVESGDPAHCAEKVVEKIVEVQVPQQCPSLSKYVNAIIL